ncbi:hypothetical protein NQ318_016707, partial [Aromia moschata]
MRIKSHRVCGFTDIAKRMRPYLTGERYQEFLQNDLVPALAVISPNENDPDILDNTLWFQQNGAPPHYARS